ncbi:MAG: TolC family protein, partial [Steroidobacteraceae bacterium]
PMPREAFMRFCSARPCRVCIGVYILVAAVAVSTVTWPAEPSSGGATPGEPVGELTLKRAIEAALTRNPDLAASAYELKAADARIAQARLRPNPEMSVELENFAGSDAAQGADALESTLSLSQVIELGGKRLLRADLAMRDRDVVGIERQAQQLDVLAEVTRRFIALVAAQDRVVLARNTKELAQRTLDAIATRVQAARSPEAEGSRARIALTRARVEEQQAQSELRGARLALAALWGSYEPAFTEATADLFTLEAVKPFEILVAQLERNPDFVRFASEARLREGELRLARAQARPNLTFGIGVRRFDETNDTALVAGFSMPLPAFDRNQGAIREAEMRLAQTDAARVAAFVRARAAVFGLYQELLASRTRLETLRSDALRQAQQALEQTQFGYERGRFSYLELSTAQQELLELRAAIIEAAADYHRLLAEIERLPGEPLSAPPR